MVSTEVKLLYDFEYAVPGTSNEIISLSAGESFSLHEEKSERWLAVKRPSKDEVYYIPSHYAEQFRIFSDSDASKRLTVPPKPPYKPKNLMERLQNDQTDEPPSPPPVDEDALIELFNIMSNSTNKSPTSSSDNLSNDKQNKFLYGEVISNEKSKETEFKEGSCNSLLGLDKEIKSSSIRKNKEQNKKKIPIPKGGELPLKVFPGGYEMYRDDISGQVYYYNPSMQQSSWILPRVDSKPRQSHSTNIAPEPVTSNYEKSKSSSEDVFSHKTQGTRSGFLSRTKLSENGGKLKKYWAQVFVSLEGSSLYFFKDQKSSSNKTKSDLVIDLPSSFVLKGGTSNKQNLIHIILSSGTEFLLHSDTPQVADQWFHAISELANKEAFHYKESTTEGLIKYKEIGDEAYNKQHEDSSKIKHKNGSSEQPASEKTKLREKLKLWLLRRPTQDALREKGIYRDPIFGSSLSSICKKENSNVPSFVVKCIDMVDKEGLLVDGIYRVSGNVADVQKLRSAVNQSTSYDLSTLDIHVVTGALKLFLRELEEPLFPFEHYNSLIQALDSPSKVEDVKHIVAKFPEEYYSTLKELLRHLLKIVQHSGENRMHTTNLAIVFGPTLLWPKEPCDHSSLARSLMKRGQLVELLLQGFNIIFSTSAGTATETSRV